jgi:hypothetical protein
MKRVFSQLIIATSLLLLVGCPEWNSVPTVVDQNHGKAYQNMVSNQTLCPEHGVKAKDPTLCPEHSIVMGIDGQKSSNVINAYRQGANMPIEDAKKGVKFDVKNVGGNDNN